MARTPSIVHRNRVIYQSEALFVSPDATGYHYTGLSGFGLMTPPKNNSMEAGGNVNGKLHGWILEDDTFANWPKWNPGPVLDPALAESHGSVIKQLKRVQSVNYGFTVNRTDINQFGHLARLDSVVIENPTVNLDFSYYLLDGYNERHLEFVTNGYDNALSGHLDPEYYQAGSNYFILTTPESRDAVAGDINLNRDDQELSKSVISIGNGYITDYTVDLAVGSIPSASVTIEGMNIQSNVGSTGIDLPSVDIYDGSKISDAWTGEHYTTLGNNPDACTGLFSLPATNSGYTGCDDVAALRPGDIMIDLGEKSLISMQTSGDHRTNSQKGAAHIQSASINLGLSRTNLQRLGSTFAFSKPIDTPITVTLSVSALMSELKEQNLVDILCKCEEADVNITIFDPACTTCHTKKDPPAMRFSLRGAKLDSENFGSSIGDNKTVDLEFSAQVGGADDLAKGLFISGKEGNPRNAGATWKPDGTAVTHWPLGGADVWGLPPGFTGEGGAYNRPTSPAKFRPLQDEAGIDIPQQYDILGYRR